MFRTAQRNVEFLGSLTFVSFLFTVFSADAGGGLRAGVHAWRRGRARRFKARGTVLNVCDFGISQLFTGFFT